ncbi:MAG: hypothetical protein ACPG05_05655 [Bdellovibrionales bacterium]
MGDRSKGSESGFVTIPANSQISPPYAGRFIGCLSSTVDIIISVDNGAKTVFGAGLKLIMPEDEQFEKVTFYNDTAEDITLEIIWGFGDIVDSRLTVTGNLNVQNTEDTPLFTVDVGGNLTTTRVTVNETTATIRSANGSRKSTRIKNLGPNIVDLSHSYNMTYGQNYPLMVGEEFDLKTTDNVYARCNAGLTSIVAVFDVL